MQHTFTMRDAAACLLRTKRIDSGLGALLLTGYLGVTQSPKWPPECIY